MTSVALQAVNLRLDVMSMALAELARAVPPSQAARVAEAIVKQAMDRLAGASMSEIADESIAADLAPLLSALQRRSGAVFAVVGSQARLQSASAKHPRTDPDKLNGL